METERKRQKWYREDKTGVTDHPADCTTWSKSGGSVAMVLDSRYVSTIIKN